MDVLEKPGKKVVILGNEAVARGALESGVGVVASYPGTPTAEVPATLARIAKEVGFYFEYSSNEKVAFETAAGAAFCGVRALTTMKHFGLNVASDSVMPVAYAGVRGGFVVMVGDDPQGWSSAQSEQDSRYYARLARMPMIEPSHPQECLDLTRLAFEMSEEFEIPVFLRTTTKVSHSIGTVTLGAMRKPKTKGEFKKEPSRFYNIGTALQEQHRRIDKKLEKIEKKYGEKINKVYGADAKIGIIANGPSFDYAQEAILELGLKLPIAKLTMTYPISKSFISKFIRDKKEIIVLEELEPIIEDFVKQVAKDVNPKLIVHGKDVLPRVGEYNLETVIPPLAKLFGKKFRLDFAAHKKKVDKALKGLPPRKPVLCAGCPHRSTFYAVSQVFGRETVWSGDIGCYVLGVFEPYDMQDFTISMGASLGLGHGIKLASDQEVVALIGDSTFFHGSMPGIANLKYNDGRTPLIVILDNSVTAMTGHQPHPGTGVTGMGEKVEPIKIEDVAKALGAEVRIANSFNQKELIQTLNELKPMKGLRVLISRGECRLLWIRERRAAGTTFVTFEIDQNKCKKCGVCTDKFACPAISEIREKAHEVPEYRINPEMCWGCSVCAQVCPYKAIGPSKKGEKGEV
jgi:indolepyruvate ferredoxin oxidoreductase alpha subunit